MHVEQSLSFLRLQYLVLLFSPYLPECTILPQRLQVNSSAMRQAGWMHNKSGTQLRDQGRSEKLRAIDEMLQYSFLNFLLIPDGEISQLVEPAGHEVEHYQQCNELKMIELVLPSHKAQIRGNPHSHGSCTGQEQENVDHLTAFLNR